MLSRNAAIKRTYLKAIMFQLLIYFFFFSSFVFLTPDEKINWRCVSQPDKHSWSSVCTLFNIRPPVEECLTNTCLQTDFNKTACFFAITRSTLLSVFAPVRKCLLMQFSKFEELTLLTPSNRRAVQASAAKPICSVVKGIMHHFTNHQHLC